ncbi:phage baseplate plug protein [Burkholderia territorii]|uniref:phage baseplate plug family protein n=1 Tax=Burkholderia territorii TaxID=1503055 RepID=UPI000754168C|nr:hypothetical protein [Burkholderia territorii]KWO54482.1 hypothetical protein WT98_08995 [Burkholderia territorii]
MLTIALAATPSQRLSINLAQQACGINLYQKRTGLYLDLYVAGSLIIAGVLCRNRVYLVREAYLGFRGDLAFVDTAGNDDPDYTALGTRWPLLYLEVAP